MEMEIRMDIAIIKMNMIIKKREMTGKIKMTRWRWRHKIQ